MAVREAYSAIGLDIGPGVYRAAQCVHAPGRPDRVWRLARGPLDDDSFDDGVLERVWSALERQGFRGGAVTLLAPPADVAIESLQTPPVDSGAPIDSIVRAELDRRGVIRSAEAQVAWWPLPGGESVTAAAIPEEAVERSIHAFARIGVDVVAVDIESHALARSCGAMREPGWDGVGVAVSIEHAGITLAAIREGVVVYERRLTDVSPQDWSAPRAFAERVAEELLVCLEFTDDRYGASGDGWSVLAGAAPEGMADAVESVTNVPTRAFGAACVMPSVDPGRLRDRPEMARALGLAMRDERTGP